MRTRGRLRACAEISVAIDVLARGRFSTAFAAFDWVIGLDRNDAAVIRKIAAVVRIEGFAFRCSGKLSDCQQHVNTPFGDARLRLYGCAMGPDDRAPTLAEMEAMAHDMLAQLPEKFRALCEGVVIQIDDFPTKEVLKALEAESEFDMLGLFEGTGLPFQANDESGRLPNIIWLYRRPILDYWAEHDETLGHVVRHVLVHEVGHHFGLSDEDMEEIEAAAV